MADTTNTTNTEEKEMQQAQQSGTVDFSEKKAKAVLSEAEIVIAVELGSGNVSSTAWGCDLPYDYVKTNGDYRT